MSLHHAEAQEEWVDRTAAAGIGGILNDVAFGRDLFVAVGTNSVFGLIHSSPDGETWTDHTQAANIGGILHGVGFGDGRFVAVGTNTAFGVIASSTNGTAWADHTGAANIGGILRDVAFGNGVWVTVGDIGGLGVIATSTNGTTWTNRTTTANVAGILYGVTFADGKFVVVGTNGALVVFAVSQNGQNWDVHTTTNAIGGAAYAVTHDGTQFVATGDGTPSGGSTTAHVLTSPNGTVWTSRTMAAGLGGIGYGMDSGGGTTVLVGRTGVPGLIATSADGVDWSNLTVASQAPGDLHGVVRGPQRWVAVGTNQVNGVVMTSETETGGGVPMFFDDALEVGSTGGNIGVAVLAGAGVEWTVTEEADWVFLNGASGSGNGQATAIVQFNGSAQPRSATLMVGTDTLVINQAGVALNAPVLDGWYSTESNEISLFWNQVFASEGYEIERRTDLEDEFVLFAEQPGAASTSTTDASVSGGATYDYRVRAYAGQLYSDWSNIVNVGAPPDIPDDLSAAARNSSQIELTWTDVSGEAGYLIFRADNDEQFFQQIARVPPNEERYIDSGLEAASVYRYEIEAESSVFGRRSPQASATTHEAGLSVLWGEAEVDSSGEYYGAATGNGVAVLVGAAGRVTTSPDFALWSDEAPPAAETLRAVAFGQNQFVAAGDTGTLLRSADGEVWNPAASPVDEDLVGVAYSQGLWVAIGKDGALLTSPDGAAWTSQPSPAETGFVDVFAGGDKFIAIEDTGRFLTSDDGMAWRETRGSDPDDGIEPFFWTRTGGAFGGGAYSVVGPNGQHSFGPDGEDWSEATVATFNYFEAVAYGVDRFVAVGLNGRTGYSMTGQGYFNGTSQEASLNCVAHGPGGFVAAGGRGLIVTSANGISWTTVQEPGGTTAHLATIVAGNGQLLAFGQTDFDGVTIRNDFDGLGWIEQQFSIDGIEFSPMIHDALYIGGQYVAVGGEGVVATSPDGENWMTRRTREPGPFNDDLRGIAAGQNQLIAVGGNDPVLSSDDGGVTWVGIEELPNLFTAWNVTYGPRWVGHFGGSGTLRVYYSDDGETWMPSWVVGGGGNVSAIALGTLDGEPLLVGAGAQFGGGVPQSMVSWDGRNWMALEAEGIDASVSAIAYGSGVFVAAGSDGAFVWASLDGAHWEPAPAGFLPEDVAQSGGIRDIAYYQGDFYGIGFSGLIVRMGIASSAVPPGPELEPAAVEITQDGPNFLLSWPSEPGLTYQVLQRTDLAAGDWMPVGPAREGTGQIMTFEAEVLAGAPDGFWVIVTTLLR